MKDYEDNGEFEHGKAADESVRRLEKKLEVLAKYRKYFDNEAEAFEYARKLALLKRGDAVMVPNPDGQGWLKAVFLDQVWDKSVECATFITFMPAAGYICTGSVPLMYARVPEEDL